MSPVTSVWKRKLLGTARRFYECFFVWVDETGLVGKM